MRLERLQLRNWRSFPQCDVNLDQDVTLIIGQNGTGKTALLNAFVWGLYGETTAGFSRPHDLCNHQAKLALAVGESTPVEVTVTFRHGAGLGEYRWEVRRSLAVTRTGPAKDDFEESEPQFVVNCYPLGATGDARTYRDDRAAKEVRSIIPVGLNPYFFFPAENIGASIDAPDSKASSIKEAVDVLLGLKRFEIASTTIKEALRLPQLKEKRSNDLALTKAQEKKDKARADQEAVSEELAQLPGDLRRVKEIAEQAEEEMKRIEGALDLIKQREEIQAGYDAAQRAAVEAENAQRKVLNEECFTLFGAGVLAKAHEVLDKAKADGKIPPKVSAGLLDELIDAAAVCICGQPIGEAERVTLREHRTTVVEDALAEFASSVRARVAVKDERLRGRADSETPQALLKAAAEALHNAHGEMTTWLDKRDAFDDENPTLPAASGANPVETWKKYVRLGDELEDKQKELTKRNEELTRLKREAENEYERLQRAQGKADAVGEARAHLFHVERVIEDLQELLRGRSRRDIERAINTIVNQIFYRNYTIHLNEEFELEVRQDDLHVGASSSERAWVTFAFVGAIARLIDEYDKHLDSMDEAGDIEIESGSGYPLVLDAPFSPFGDEYAEQFAAQLPHLVPQSVVIVREDQLGYLDPIMVGDSKVRAYLMCFHGPRDDVHQAITWGDGTTWGDGSERPYVKPAGAPSLVRTEIMELPT